MAAKNVIIVLLALCSFAYGQTRALIVDTNGRINYDNAIIFGGPLEWLTNNASAATTRSNLSLGLPALTNTSNAGLLSAIGGLATNGDASAMTNFPVYLLRTNGDAIALTNFPVELLRTDGDAATLTNFPSELLRTNGDASALTNFPSALLRTNGDGSGLTNLPNANLTNATGVLPIANGGTGQTNAEAAIEALLPAYTNNADKILALNSNATGLVWTTNAGGGGSGSVTNVDASGGTTGLTFSGGPITNGGTLTLGGVLNLASGGTGGTNASEARTALELGTAATNDATAFQSASTNLDTLASNNAINLTNFPAGLATYPSFSNNAGLVLAVTTNETSVEWIAVSNTVTDASTLTNFPASILQTNSADGSFPLFLARTNADASGFTNFPTFNQNTTGTASNVTGIVQITNGGTGTNSAAGARVNLLPSYTGNSNKVLAVNAGETDVEWVAQSGGGTVNLTNVTGTLARSNGGTGGTNYDTALSGIGVFLIGVGAAGSVVLGEGASAGIAASGNVAVGSDAKTQTTTAAANSVAIGRDATTTNTLTVALGANARAAQTSSVQIGAGTNTNSSTIQFLSAGAVDTNEWARIAALSTYPTTNISVVGTNNTNTLVFSNGILVEVQ